MKVRIGIRSLLLAVNAFALAMPIIAIVWLRVFDDQLIRRTEAQLIGQGVLIAEAWREEWLREMGIQPDRVPRYAPDAAGDARYFPIEPTLSLDQGVLPPAPDFAVVGDVGDGARSEIDGVDRSAASAAGARVQPILLRAVRMNLSSARVLDKHGCVVASSGAQLGVCMSELPEVRDALSGRYAAVLRHRISDEPPPRFESISRRGRVRVYTAIPVLSDGEVIGVVRMGRTAIDAGKALWFDRERLLVALAVCAVFTSLLSLFLSRTIARPLRAITEAARRIAAGEGRAPFDAPKLAPRELRSVSHALDQMTTQLSDRAEYIADFATNVSHELKTPIASIRGAAELLAHHWPEMKDSERQRFLSNIEEDAERMERLVSRLLELARIQNTPDSTDDIDLHTFLEDICGSYGETVALKTDRLRGRLRIHPDHLESAVRNLLENAIRHGGGHPVEVEAARAGDRIAIRVRDHGPGISPANRSRVFDRFFTTQRDSGGTGLGLAIAKAVAETRGGHLRFSTGPEGTCFELLL